MSKEIESSDEEAPESISFGKSREEALTVLKEAAEISKGTFKQKKLKEEKKKRRQERKDEKTKTENQLKNEEKLKNLREKAKEALSDDVKEPAKNSKKVFTDDNGPSDNEADDFIPFNSSKSKVKRTSRELNESGASNLRVQMIGSKKPKVLAAESVLNFRETMLYGAGSKVKRESSKSVIARKNKVKMIGSDVLCSR